MYLLLFKSCLHSGLKTKKLKQDFSPLSWSNFFDYSKIIEVEKSISFNKNWHVCIYIVPAPIRIGMCVYAWLPHTHSLLDCYMNFILLCICTFAFIFGCQLIMRQCICLFVTKYFSGCYGKFVCIQCLIQPHPLHAR